MPQYVPPFVSQAAPTTSVKIFTHFYGDKMFQPSPETVRPISGVNNIPSPVPLPNKMGAASMPNTGFPQQVNRIGPAKIPSPQKVDPPQPVYPDVVPPNNGFAEYFAIRHVNML